MPLQAEILGSLRTDARQYAQKIFGRRLENLETWKVCFSLIRTKGLRSAELSTLPQDAQHSTAHCQSNTVCPGPVYQLSAAPCWLKRAVSLLALLACITAHHGPPFLAQLLGLAATGRVRGCS